jgi:uncharacterized phage protein (TIGR01671 family)
MREIKFRAWDKENKFMLKIFDNTTQENWYLPQWKERHEVMQYTGLKDKNGKEIYEGDILRVQTGWYKSAKNEVDKFDKGVKGETLWTVEHKIFNCEMGFMIYGLDRRFHKLMTQSMMWNTKAEVIGNIYDNPELLGGE